MSRAAVAEVVQLCSEVAALASPVVCNSSPEGFLPGAKVYREIFAALKKWDILAPMIHKVYTYAGVANSYC